MKYNFCPNCGFDKINYDGVKKYSCEKCNWIFYLNPAAACGVIIENYEQDSILILVRNQNPEKGKYDIPGGFVDPNEPVETAIFREAREELGVCLQNIKYFRSFPNNYHYANTTYPTCDLIFTANLTTNNIKIQEEEVAVAVWLKKESLLENLDKIAFPSIKNALKLYLSGREEVEK